MIGFGPNLAGMILRGWGLSDPEMAHLAPLGAQGQGPKGPKVGNFQTSSSLDPETVQLIKVTVCVCVHVHWRQKISAHLYECC